MTASISLERAELAAKLNAAAIADGRLRATVDPAAQVPMILIDAASYDSPNGIGSWTVTIPVRVISPPPGDAAALALLEAGVEAVYAVLGFAPATPGTWAPAPNLQAMPAYTIAYTRQIPNPAC